MFEKYGETHLSLALFNAFLHCWYSIIIILWDSYKWLFVKFGVLVVFHCKIFYFFSVPEIEKLLINVLLYLPQFCIDIIWHNSSLKKHKYHSLSEPVCRQFKSEKNLKKKWRRKSHFFFRGLLLLEIHFKVSANTFLENDLFKHDNYAKVRLIPVT